MSTMTWVVTLTYDMQLGETEGNRLADELDAHLDGGVFSMPRGQTDVTYWADGPDPLKAASVAREELASFLSREPVGIEVVTEEEFARRATEPTLPELVSTPEVAEELAVSRQRVHQLRAHPQFPVPLFELRTGPIWDARGIRHFARTWDRRPGRRKVS